MVMAKVTNQREKDKFVEDANEKTAVRTLPTGGATSANQTLILTELGQKTEPADIQKAQEQNPITGFATSANQTDGSQVAKIKGMLSPTTTAVTLTTLNTTYKLPASELASRKTILIYNISDTSVYIGGSTVTTANGILLPPAGIISIDCESDLYAICGTSGKIVNILEFA